MLALKDETTAFPINAPNAHVKAAGKAAHEAFILYPKLEAIVVSMYDFAVKTESLVTFAGGIKVTEPET